MKIPIKEKIFICHEKGDIKDRDVRENFPVWRDLTSLLGQFKDHTSNLNLSLEDKKKLNQLTFYLEKVVEHYDFEIPEFSFSILCSIIESMGKSSPDYGFKKFKNAIKTYFDPVYIRDKLFMDRMKEIYYSVGRCSFSHSAKRLHPFAQIGSKASISLGIMKMTKNYDLIGNKHLFQIAVEVITNYFDSKKIN
jgi:hypothetical protein